MFFYRAELRLKGFLWYHTLARATESFYTHSVVPVVHNYGLTLALAGYDADPAFGYVSIYGRKGYRSLLELFREHGVYAYPAIAKRAYTQEVIMSAIGESTVQAKGKGRLSYPDFTKNVVLAPGSILETLIVSEGELPSRFAVRIGAKRAGTLWVELTRVPVDIANNRKVTHPFNVNDVVRVDGYTVLLRHEAGDVGIFGVAEEAYVVPVRDSKTKEVVVPALKLE